MMATIGLSLLLLVADSSLLMLTCNGPDDNCCWCRCRWGRKPLDKWLQHRSDNSAAIRLCLLISGSINVGLVPRIPRSHHHVYVSPCHGGSHGAEIILTVCTIVLSITGQQDAGGATITRPPIDSFSFEQGNGYTYVEAVITGVPGSGITHYK